MKKEYDIIFFFNHIKKILYFNSLIQDTNKEFKFKQPKNDNISSTYIVNELLKVINQRDEANNVNDHRNIKNFKHDEKYYYNKIYNTYDINKFEPELEFCETAEQQDIWNYYRLRISSHPYNKPKGRQIYIFIRDKLTKKYVGLTSLTSDHLYNTLVDKFIGWNMKNKINSKRLNSIMNISTCIGIPPFSYNYNVGKLCAKLMFSQEIYDYVYNKYKDKLVGLVTLSLYGKSIQYDRLKELKFLGLTQGYGASHVDNKLYNIIEKYMEQNNIGQNKTFKSRMFKIKYFCNQIGIRDITFHGIHRGVYFGYLGSNVQDFLNAKTDDFIADKIKPVHEIFNDWKNRWAINRFSNLVQNKKLMIDYEFQNYTNNKEYNKWRINKYLKNKYKEQDNDKDKIYTILTDNDKLDIIKIWYNNKNKSFYKIAEIVKKQINKKVDRRTISSIVSI